MSYPFYKKWIFGMFLIILAIFLAGITLLTDDPIYFYLSMPIVFAGFYIGMFGAEWEYRAKIKRILDEGGL